jgi:hypothetical protein
MRDWFRISEQKFLIGLGVLLLAGFFGGLPTLRYCLGYDVFEALIRFNPILGWGSIVLTILILLLGGFVLVICGLAAYDDEYLYFPTPCGVAKGLIAVAVKGLELFSVLAIPVWRILRALAVLIGEWVDRFMRSLAELIYNILYVTLMFIFLPVYFWKNELEDGVEVSLAVLIVLGTAAWLAMLGFGFFKILLPVLMR